MKNFVLIGASGYVAPRHMEAIKQTGNNLIAALDKNDSVGIIDRYFPEATFFTEFERFDRYLSKMIQYGTKIDYVSICSPNYLHDAHIRFGLRLGASVICEKPLVINPWNIKSLSELEYHHVGKIYTILQLRLHPDLMALKHKIEHGPPDKVYDVELTYLTSRGKWYFASWKGDESKSGGISTNIGIHFFDLLYWLFGDIRESMVHSYSHDRASGYLEFANARVKWFLSINRQILKENFNMNGASTYRSIKVDGSEIEFSKNFTDLHTRSYKEILDGNGFGIHTAKKAIKISYDIRNSKPQGLVGQYHRLARHPADPHPFKIEEFM